MFGEILVALFFMKSDKKPYFDGTINLE